MLVFVLGGLHLVKGVGICSNVTYTKWQVLVFALVWPTLSDRCWYLVLCYLH